MRTERPPPPGGSGGGVIGRRREEEGGGGRTREDGARGREEGGRGRTEQEATGALFCPVFLRVFVVPGHNDGQQRPGAGPTPAATAAPPKNIDARKTEPRTREGKLRTPPPHPPPRGRPRGRPLSSFFFSLNWRGNGDPLKSADAAGYIIAATRGGVSPKESFGAAAAQRLIFFRTGFYKRKMLFLSPTRWSRIIVWPNIFKHRLHRLHRNFPYKNILYIIFL